VNNIATLKFKDVISGHSVVFVVRADIGRVGICVSLEQNGDVETFIGPEDCENLCSAIRLAEQMARSTSSLSNT
jgi:hypothetical protein